MKSRILPLVLACSLLVACKPAPLSITPTTAGLEVPATAPSVVSDAEHKTGSLMLSVKWPERSYEGFNAQAIPLSTNALVVDITDSKGAKVAHEVLKRTSGTLVTTKEMVLSVGTGYRVDVKAYAATDPTDQDEILAQTNAVNVAVTWNVSTPLKLSLAPNFAPIIFDISAPQVGAGATLELAGINLDRGSAPPVVVFPSGVTATGTLSNGKIRVTVPAGAGTGDLMVKVDGILSVTSISFNQLTQLSLAASSSTDTIERLESDGVIHTWLGDSFLLTPQASDSSGSALTDPTITGWNNASGSVGTLDASGSYRVTATGITTGGTDLVTANSGSVSAVRQVLVAPPAGATLNPHPANDPLPADASYTNLAATAQVPGSTEGIAITKFGNKYLIAWGLKGYANIAWRVLNADGTPASPIKLIPCYRYLNEVQPLVASRGNDAIIMFRNSLSQMELDAYQINADLSTFAYKVVDTNWGLIDSADASRSVFLGNLASNGSNYMLGYYVSADDGYHYKTRKFTNDGQLVLSTTDATSYIRQSNVNGTLHAPNVDRASLTTDGTNYYLRFYYDQGGILKYFWTWFHSDGTQDTSAQVVTPSTPERYLGGASNGTTQLLTSINTQTTNNSLTYAVANMSMTGIPEPAIIGSLDGAITDPINFPVTAVWDGNEYLVCYTRMRVINTIMAAQPMVQAISAAGTLIGKPYAIAPSGSKATIARLDGEGAWCTWLDDNNELKLRKLKFR